MSGQCQALYEKIYQHYKELILTEQLAAGTRLPTEAQLVEKFAVSRITAKRALDELEKDGYIRRRRGSGSYVNSLEEHFASGQNTIRQIAFVVPIATGEGPFLQMMQGASGFLEHYQYRLSLYDSKQWDEKSEQKSLIQAREDGCDGIIYYPGPIDTGHDILYRMTAARYPIVMLDHSMDPMPITSVVSDNVAGAYELTNYLLKKGHRKIAFIAATNNLVNSIGERFLGCCRAMNEAGLPAENMIMQGVFDSDDELVEQMPVYGKIMAERIPIILQQLREKGVTAICALNDDMAMRVYQAMEKLGLSVPKDMAVGGFDDLEYARLSTPALTTVRQDFNTMGYEAAKALYHLIQHPDAAPKKLVIPTRLIERFSI